MSIYLCIYSLNYLFIFIGNTSTLISQCDMPHTPSLNTVQYVNMSLYTADTNKSNYAHCLH